MQMNASSIVNQKAEWEKLGVKLPPLTMPP